MNKSLLKQLDHCDLADRHRLRFSIQKLKRMRADSKQQQQALATLTLDLERSVARCRKRSENIPAHINIAPELPIADRADELSELIAKHQVLVVAGETGSGKTTQIPKLCLTAGLGRRGLIGHTQPRRLAAVSVANRIAEELGTSIGSGVGYQIRFNDSTSPSTFLKIMTDGILLTEIQQDKFLNKYEVLIIDEAHERSLNIDFILGFLKQLLPRRPELKLIITSATIDLEKFSSHFDDAPIVTVSGRTYPVELRYAPVEAETDTTVDDDRQIDAIVNSVWDIHRAEKSRTGPGDILVFLSSEKEIRETALSLRKQSIPDIEVMPLYARLRQSDQVKVFKPHRGRRVILSTNIAETSLTVPGIRYVIDAGYARISRYSVQSKIQRLPIEPVSQASANQRAGRCGRVAEGICIRLYSEEDFNSRPAFTDAEIQRTNLAAVILQMISLKLGQIDQFPFIEKPESKAINDGFKLLFELGAINDKHQLTDIGRKMSRLPVEPRFARMLIASARNGSLREVLIIVSGLSVQDPRESPADKRQAAQEKHSQFAHVQSDFLSYVNLWDAYEQLRQDLTQSQLRKYCQQNFLSFQRMREWRETHRQLVMLCHQLKMPFSTQKAGYSEVHAALLTGSLNQVARQSEGAEYLGSRNRKFRVLRGSSVARNPGKWIICDQIIETGQAFTSTAAKVEPEWIETAASHLTTKIWNEPHWSKKKQQVMAHEKVSLYGLVIIEDRRVAYSTIDPVLCRELFISEALVGRQLESNLSFYNKNCSLVSSVEKQEDKLRKQSYFIDHRLLEKFYDERLPEEVNDLASLSGWYLKQRKDNKHLLVMQLDDVIPASATEQVKKEFPDHAALHKNALAISYKFDPGSAGDGATIDVPVELLGQLQQRDLDWAVPGQLKERCVLLLKSLPKAVRRQLIPLPAFVDDVIEKIGDSEPELSLLDTLIYFAKQLKDVEIDKSLLEQIELPEFLRVKIKVVNDSGKALGSGADLSQLQIQYVSDQQKAPSTRKGESSHRLELDEVSDWTFGDFPEQVEVGTSLKLLRYPAIVDAAQNVSLRLLTEKAEAARLTRAGLTRLYMLKTAPQVKQLLKEFEKTQKQWGLKIPEYLQGKQRSSEFVFGLYSHCFEVNTVVPRDRQQFEVQLEKRSELFVLNQQVLKVLDKVVEQQFSLQRAMKHLKHPSQLSMSADIKVQLSNLFCKEFLSLTDYTWIMEYPRYLQAIEYRIEKYSDQPDKDAQLQKLLRMFWEPLLERATKQDMVLNAFVADNHLLSKLRWMIEEYRVSLFAQHLKTKVPVSEKRLRAISDELKL